MEILISFSKDNPILIIIASIVLFVIMVIMILSYFEGREISFWPPRVGGKPQNENKKPHSSLEEEFAKADNKCTGNEKTPEKEGLNSDDIASIISELTYARKPNDNVTITLQNEQIKL